LQGDPQENAQHHAEHGTIALHEVAQSLWHRQVGAMLREWEKKHPGRIENMFSALQHIVPSHLMDAAQYDFKGLKVTGVASEEGDKAFDEESFSAPSLPGVQVVNI